MNIIFEKVNAKNWYECSLLKVGENQKNFIETTAISMLQCVYEPEWIPVCIYDENIMIGFAMYGTEIEKDRIWLDRIMIDKRFQGKGYGKIVMIKLIKLIKNIYNCNEIYLSINFENKYAEKFYKKLGFEMTNEIDCGEAVMILKM